MGTVRAVTNGPSNGGDIGYNRRSRRSHFSGSSGEQTQEGDRRESYGPDVTRDFPALARLRATIEDRSPRRRDWSDYAIIAGAILLAGAILMTLLLALHIDARANRLVETDAQTAKRGAETVSRLEGKLDTHTAETSENARKLDILIAGTTTTTTLPPSRGRTTTTRRGTPTTTRAQTPPPTTRPPSPPTTTTTTTRPCVLSLLNLCLAR